MEKIRTLIVDDEAPARRRIRQFLSEFHEPEIVGECEDGLQAVAFINELSPDLLFLDVQMPNLDGFGVIRNLASGTVPAIVFVTAYDHFALRAFEVNALDYLLKPFSRERFRQAFERAKNQINLANTTELDERLRALVKQLTTESDYPARLEVKSVGRTMFVPVDDVDWIEAESNYSRLHAGDKEYLVRETLGSLEQRLDPTIFVRVHRSAIVKVSCICEVRPELNGDQLVILRNGTRVEMSRTYRDKAMSLLKGSGRRCQP